MPFLCGPKNSRFTYTGSLCPHLDLALRSTARSLGEAILEYEAHFNTKIEPLAEPFEGNPENVGKYFHMIDLDDSANWIVDIHIFSKNSEICVKQDLDFTLEPDDIVELGELIC